jgi:hypothetical protein
MGLCWREILVWLSSFYSHGYRIPLAWRAGKAPTPNGQYENTTASHLPQELQFPVPRLAMTMTATTTSSESKLPQEKKDHPNGGPKLLSFKEAPVGIEPTNGGFAVL